MRIFKQVCFQSHVSFETQQMIYARQVLEMFHRVIQVNDFQLVTESARYASAGSPLARFPRGTPCVSEIL